MAKRRPRKKPLTLTQRVTILERHVDGLIAQCQLDLDTRLKAVEKLVNLLARDVSLSRQMSMRGRGPYLPQIRAAK